MLAGWFIVLATVLAVLANDAMAGVVGLVLLSVGYAVAALWSGRAGYVDGERPRPQLVRRVTLLVAATGGLGFLGLTAAATGLPDAVTLSVLGLASCCALAAGAIALYAVTRAPAPSRPPAAGTGHDKHVGA
jgi:hypothetical protein